MQPRTERWQGAVDSFGWIEGPEILLFTEGEAHELLLALHRPGGQRIVVERAWIQTILGARWRQDQVVFRLNTAEPDVEIRLPEGTDPEEVWAAVAVGSPGNVQKFRREVTPRGALQLFLPEHLPSEPVFVELIYRLPRGLMAFQPVRVEFATIEGEVWVQRAYWQVSGTSAVAPGAGPTELVWGVSAGIPGGLFFRQPTLEDSQLADWAGAIQPQRIPQAAEVYLFKRGRLFGACPGRFLQRAAIVFGASALFLLVGLGLMYFPALRRPAFLWFLGPWIGAWSLVSAGVCPAHGSGRLVRGSRFWGWLRFCGGFWDSRGSRRAACRGRKPSGTSYGCKRRKSRPKQRVCPPLQQGHRRWFFDRTCLKKEPRRNGTLPVICGAPVDGYPPGEFGLDSRERMCG